MKKFKRFPAQLGLMLRGYGPMLAVIVLCFPLGACHGSQKEQAEDFRDHMLVTLKGADRDCDGNRTIDPALRPLLDDYIADAEEYGQNQFPIDRLADIREFRLVPLGSSELRGDINRLGLNNMVECYDGRRVFRIFIADPGTTPANHRVRSPNIFRQVVYHELTHTHFQHYDDRPDAGTNDFGIMAAITDDRVLSDDELDRRKFELFSPESGYRDHLPNRD